MIPRIYRPLAKCGLAACILIAVTVLCSWISENLWEPAGVITIVCLIVLTIFLPARFILVARNTLEEMQFQEKRGCFPTLLRVLLAGPLGCIGLCAILIGIAVPVWVIWNLFDPQPEFQGNPWSAIFQIGLFILMIPLGWHFIRLSLGRKVGPTISEERAAEEEFREALSNPDITSFEAAFDRQFPVCLHQIYGSTERSMSLRALEESVTFPFGGNDDEAIQISTFIPIATENRCDKMGDPDPSGEWYCFAVTENQELLAIPANGEDLAVYLVSEEERIFLTDSIDEFCEKLVVR